MLLPVGIFDNFLGPERAAVALDFALLHRGGFETSAVVTEDGPIIDPALRSSESFTGDWSEIRELFGEAIMAQRADILAAANAPDFEQDELDLQLVASRDGGLFGLHSDTGTGDDRMDADRVVSSVYYMHRLPKAFSGGELVMHAIGGGETRVIEPVHDRLVVFPSFAPHEVARIIVPGDAFEDARFSINCWLCRKRG